MSTPCADISGHPREPAATCVWIFIERQHSIDVTVGPYASEAEAASALSEAVLIDALCEEDCLGAHVRLETELEGLSHDRVLVDANGDSGGLGLPEADPLESSLARGRASLASRRS